MAKTNPQNYITDLLQPIPGRGGDRRAWSIPVISVWCPFFTATNTTGQTAIDADVLGAPLRLQRNQDGTPKFGNNGKPAIRVAKELSDHIRIVRENFTSGLMGYVDSVRKEMPNEFKAQVESAIKAGESVAAKDNGDLLAYILAQAEPVEPIERAEPAESEKELVAA